MSLFRRPHYAGAHRAYQLLGEAEIQRIVQEGYDFLDEKRLLLAAEVMRQLERYQALAEEFQALHRRAVPALAEALAEHGLQGLQVHPADTFAAAPAWKR